MIYLDIKWIQSINGKKKRIKRVKKMKGLCVFSFFLFVSNEKKVFLLFSIEGRKDVMFVVFERLCLYSLSES